MDDIKGMRQIGTVEDDQDLVVKGIGSGQVHFAVVSQNSQVHFYLSRAQINSLIRVLQEEMEVEEEA